MTAPGDPTIGGLLRQSVGVGALYVAAQVPAFFIPSVIAATFGATPATDAFFLAYAVAAYVANSASGAGHAAVPFLVQEEPALLRRGVGIAAGTAAVLFVAALFLAGPVVAAWSGLAAPARRSMQRFLLGLAPFVVVSAVAAMWGAAVNARREYWSTAAAHAARSLVVLGIVAGAGGALGGAALVLAFVSAEAVRALVLGWRLRRPPRAKRAEAGGDPESRLLARSLLAQVAGTAVIGVVPIVDRLLASTLGPGSVSVLDYAERIWQVPLALALSGFSLVSLTEWSRLARLGREGGPREQAGSVAALFFAVSLPFCLAAVFFRMPIARLLFGHGAFPEADLPRLSAALAALVAGVPIYLVGLVYVRVFLAARRSDLLFLVATIGVVFKIALNTVAAARWGVVGLAAATSAMYALNSILLVAICPRLRFGEPS